MMKNYPLNFLPSRVDVECKVESGPKLKVKINGKHVKIVTLAHLKLVANFSQ